MKMTMGEYIKHLRTGHNVYGRKWSQEQIGSLLNPPVNRSAVNKWESGMVENLKRTHVIQLAELFGVNASDLMCFDSMDDSELLNEVTAIEFVQNKFGIDALELLQLFDKLNDEGRRKAIEQLNDLIEHPKYMK